ncbi:hypothetical protein DN412_40610 [Cupriavidus lacunae]|uniref:Uncharacterized protein n=1 Tax=Cupriavidus lacunae TaxID=2666307 RepID=A0A370N9I6_9BURK|nr:hypothetical protein DN412_40610 [Cupriavidus lacunae]
MRRPIESAAGSPYPAASHRPEHRHATREIWQGEAEAALARQLLAELRVAPRGRQGGSGRRRKTGGTTPTGKEAPGARAVPLNAEAGDDGNPNERARKRFAGFRDRWPT